MLSIFCDRRFSSICRHPSLRGCASYQSEAIAIYCCTEVLSGGFSVPQMGINYRISAIDYPLSPIELTMYIVTSGELSIILPLCTSLQCWVIDYPTRTSLRGEVSLSPILYPRLSISIVSSYPRLSISYLLRPCVRLRGRACAPLR